MFNQINSEIPILKTTIDPCGSSPIECEMGSLISTESGCKCKCDDGFAGKLCDKLEIAGNSRTNESLQPTLSMREPGNLWLIQ